MSNAYTISTGKDNLAAYTEEGLKDLLDYSRLPRHVAIIMDGNGRWAEGRGVPRVAGHKRGMETVREVVTASSKLGIEVLTLYAFSIENWKRPPMEVEALMTLLTVYLRKELPLMMENDIRFMTIGRVSDLPGAARNWIDNVKEKTKNNAGMTLNLALSYGGRSEIMDAARRLAADAAEGKVSLDNLTEETFSGYLDTSGLPDPDLIIRTSGETRTSNFLPWQSAYAEYYFTETLWPDFMEKELLLALVDYQRRERRFGRTSGQVGGADAG